MILRMKPVLWISTSCLLALALSGCGSNGGSSGGPQAVTGPFDSQGRYREEWADDPSKWRKSGGPASPHELKSDEIPEIAKVEQPPQNSVPLPLANSSRPTPVISQTQVTSTPKPAARKTTEAVVVKSTRPVTKPESAAVKPKPKPKPVVAKAKVKPKPKSVRYVVKKGDSLSAIASRNGTSVSAIKSANGISGTVIRPGQSLTIPKK
jgi:LysM repeat protein